MKHIGSYDAKTKLPEILRRVSKGQSFTITNHGKPITDLVPSHETKRIKSKTAIKNILKMHKQTVSDETLKEFRESGRK